jgi:hypothetical protein
MRASRSGARSRLITHVCKPFIAAILRDRLPRGAALKRGATLAAWALVVAAVAASYGAYGWRGALLVVTALCFWLLLQFNRVVRALRAAAANPVGQVPNAVMLNARLHRGMRLPAILKVTRSLGRRLADAPETWAWADAGGDEVQVQLVAGRVTAWELKRAGS